MSDEPQQSLLNRPIAIVVTAAMIFLCGMFFGVLIAGNVDDPVFYVGPFAGLAICAILMARAVNAIRRR